MLFFARGEDGEAQDGHVFVVVELGEAAAVLVPDAELGVVGKGGDDGDIVTIGLQLFADLGHEQAGGVDIGWKLDNEEKDAHAWFALW